jgi:hypothetical protein
MQSENKQITEFLDRCNELKNCKFIMATTKIKDLLKAIVNSPELYELFNTVTAKFDYLEAKRKCLFDSSDGFGNSGYLVLPETVGDRLAFIFCLLVEFDRDTINFNWFLQHYFPEDGSYYASYHAFCDNVITNLEQLISEIFEKEIAEENRVQQSQAEIQPQPVPNAAAAEYLSRINLLIAQEKQFILESAIPEEDKQAGYNILTEIFAALKDGNLNLINALVCGYNYYILYNNSVSQNVGQLFETISLYEGTL